MPGASEKRESPQSGLQTRTATTESVSLRVRRYSDGLREANKKKRALSNVQQMRPVDL
jgi:hypothetical protein